MRYVIGADAAQQSGLASFGDWLVKAGTAYFDYDLMKSQRNASSVLQSQGLTPEQTASALGIPGSSSSGKYLLIGAGILVAGLAGWYLARG